jgi:hypothetical protein
MEILREVRELRKQFCLKVVRCSCGSSSIQVVAAQDITVCRYGYEYSRPVYIGVYDSEPEGCDAPNESETVMPSSKEELRRDIILAFRSLGLRLTDEDLRQIGVVLESMHDSLLQLFIDDYALQN